MAMTKRSPAPARVQARARNVPKPVATALRRAHQGTVTVADIARTAEALELPVWVLLIPGLSTAGSDIDRHAAAIQRMVESYLAENCIAPIVRELHGRIGEGALRGG